MTMSISRAAWSGCLVIPFMVSGWLMASSAALAQERGATWEGLWVAERNYGPAFAGLATLMPDGDQWQARLQGEVGTVSRSQREDGVIEWQFSFEGQGEFSGQQEGGAGSIVGHWVQPGGSIAYSPTATPVVLSKRADGSFAGMIRPLVDTVSLNLPLFPDEDYENTRRYRTFLRNPERNFGVFAPFAAAVEVDDNLQFIARNGEDLIVGTALDPGERFSLLFGRTGETLEFTRRDRATAPGFYPRRRAATLTTLLRPVELSDGWQTEAPAKSGLQTAPLLSLVNTLANFEPTALQQPYIHSLHVAHRGKLVLEEYFHGYDGATPHDSRSAGKSLTSALLGIALQQGFVDSIDTAVYPLLGGASQYDNPSDAKNALTIRHLITMTSGLDCDDGNFDSPGNEDVMQNQQDEPDWYRYTLNLAMVRDPGAAGVYCTGGINLVGSVLARSAGMSLRQFFHRYFAEPLGIDYYQMNLSPTLEAYMGGGIRLQPRDFLKLGQLYLDGGVWQGTRLLSEAYVTDSAAAQSSINMTDDYGYAWWRQTYDVDGVAVDTFYASGNGGQLLFVVPELELVVLIFAGNYSDGQTRNEFRDRFMSEHILPAAIPARQ